MVLPMTAEIASNGHLMIGGCDTVALAQKYGTPLFVLDEAHVRAQCRTYLEAFKRRDARCEVIYAGKAFLSVEFAKIINEEGLSLDIMSGGELFTALRGGFPPERMFFHGNNKGPEEIDVALGVGVGRFVVDSLNELDRLNEMAGALGKRAVITLRLTPGIVPSTHSYIQTGHEDSKFGFGVSDGTAIAATAAAMAMEHIELVGFHAHIGSQIFALHSYEKAVEVLMAFIKEAKEALGFETKELDTGGGLGIKYKGSDEPSGIEDYAETIVGGVTAQAERHGVPVPKIMIEPGRSIVGNAGVTLYTIGTIKTIPDVRTYVSVDGGMSDNLRPMLYNAVYEAVIANKANAAPARSVTVAGKHCESGDILIEDVRIPEPALGDILVTPATGAYGYVMANNYNRQPKPAVVMVKDGTVRVIIRRETYQDLLRLEQPQPGAEAQDPPSPKLRRAGRRSAEGDQERK